MPRIRISTRYIGVALGNEGRLTIIVRNTDPNLRGTLAQEFADQLLFLSLQKDVECLHHLGKLFVIVQGRALQLYVTQASIKTGDILDCTPESSYRSSGSICNSRSQRCNLSTNKIASHVLQVIDEDQYPSEMRNPQCSRQRHLHHRQREQQSLPTKISKSRRIGPIGQVRLGTFPVFAVVLKKRKRLPCT